MTFERAVAYPRPQRDPVRSDSVSPDSYLLERRHLREYSGGCLHEQHGEQTSGPFAETHVQVEERFQSQILQGDSSPRLDGAVACDDVFCRAGGEGAGYERGGVRDDAVEDDRYAVDGAGQDHTDDSSVLQSAYRRQNPDRIFRVRRVQP